jgi:predicted dithiol-disulfide oxidoreductase (DUF899 family)
MTDETIAISKSLHKVRFPNESAEYRRARDRLLEAEIALRRQVEAVAELRRRLPLGGEIPEDYVFQEGEDAHPVRLSELFADQSTLVAYSFMFGPAMDSACPNCTSILDALDGEARHISQRVSLVVIAKSPIGRILTFAKERGWRALRLLSSATNSYNIDYHGETVGGKQTSALNVFTRKGGTIHHTFAAEMQHAALAAGQGPRHVDSIWPVWGLLDFTPEGRGDFNPKLEYPERPVG